MQMTSVIDQMLQQMFQAAPQTGGSDTALKDSSMFDRYLADVSEKGYGLSKATELRQDPYEGSTHIRKGDEMRAEKYETKPAKETPVKSQDPEKEKTEEALNPEDNEKVELENKDQSEPKEAPVSDEDTKTVKEQDDTSTQAKDKPVQEKVQTQQEIQSEKKTGFTDSKADHLADVFKQQVLTVKNVTTPAHAAVAVKTALDQGQVLEKQPHPVKIHNLEKQAVLQPQEITRELPAGSKKEAVGAETHVQASRHSGGRKLRRPELNLELHDVKAEITDKFKALKSLKEKTAEGFAKIDKDLLHRMAAADLGRRANQGHAVPLKTAAQTALIEAVQGRQEKLHIVERPVPNGAGFTTKNEGTQYRVHSAGQSAFKAVTSGTQAPVQAQQTASAPRMTDVDFSALIDRIMTQMTIRAAGRTGLSTQLDVDVKDLGRVKVEIALQDNKLSGVMHVADNAVKQLIEASFSELKDALAAKGMEFADFNVDVRQHDERGASHQSSYGRNQGGVLSGKEETGVHTGGSVYYMDPASDSLSHIDLVI